MAGSGPNDSYCGDWPDPPCLLRAADTEATRGECQRIQADWRRRCPDAWAQFQKEVSDR